MLFIIFSLERISMAKDDTDIPAIGSYNLATSMVKVTFFKLPFKLNKLLVI